MARYKLTQATFIAPRLFPAGSVIEYDGPPGPQFEPQDEEARKRLDAYYEEHPNARRHFVTRLRVKGGQPGESKPATAELVKEPAQTDKVEQAGNVAQPGKATPGLSEGGKVPSTNDAGKDATSKPAAETKK